MRHIPSIVVGPILRITVFLLLTNQAWSLEEDEILKEYIFRLPKLFSWPTDYFDNANSSYLICFIGAKGDELFSEEKLLEKITEGRAIQLQRFKKKFNGKKCHILFASSTEWDLIDDVVIFLKGKPVLTVSNKIGFLRHGGMVYVGFNRSGTILKLNYALISASGIHWRNTIPAENLRRNLATGKTRKVDD